MCSQCQHVGHNQNACPDNLIKILKTKSEAKDQDESMEEEEVNGDSLFDETSSEAKLDAYGITKSYVWGELAEYKIVEPNTKEERREAHLAAQALKESRPQESTIPSPQNPV